MNYSQIVLQCLISTGIATIINFAFYKKQFKFDKKYNNALLRYENCYLKFLQFFYTCQKVGFDLFVVNPEDRQTLQNLLNDNLIYLDKKTLKAFRKFNGALNVVHSHENNVNCKFSKDELKNLKKDFSTIYRYVVQSILAESKKLSQQLGYPDITTTLELSLFSDDIEEYQKSEL